METLKPQTRAQGIFGKNFGNRKILNERPDGMTFRDYRKVLREQKRILKEVLR